MPKPEVEAKKNKDNPNISQASPSYDYKPENGKMVKVSEIILTSTSPRKAQKPTTLQRKGKIVKAPEFFLAYSASK